MHTDRKKLLWIVAAAGVAVKLAEFLYWRTSVFRYWNELAGLDMATLLKFGEWGTPGNGFFFTPHRALVAALWALGGRVHNVPGIVAAQALCAVAGAVLCADLALRFFRRDKTAAAVCGAAYLVYGPFFIYEFTVLQETAALTLILLAFYASVRARSARGFLAAGAALGACVAGRPTALFFVPAMFAWSACREFRSRRRPRREALRKMLCCLGGAAAVLCLVAGANLTLGGNASPFFNVLPYSLEFNAAPARGGSAASGYPYLEMFGNALRRAPRMLLPAEIPENLNYYYLKELMPFLKFLPGPALLLPLALAGMILALPKSRRAVGTVWLPLFTLALPLCVRDPIGRYRLTLIPYFILFAGHWVHALRGRPAKRHAAVALAVAAGCFALELPFRPEDVLRSDDFLAHAAALKLQNGGSHTEASLEVLADGWERGKFADNRLGTALYRGFVETGNDAAALGTLALGTANAPDKDIYMLYMAFRLADRGDFARAEALLRRCGGRNFDDAAAGNYHYLFAEMLNRRGAAAEARRHYEAALRYLDAGSEFARSSRRMLERLSGAPDAPRTSGTAPASPAEPSRK